LLIPALQQPVAFFQALDIVDAKFGIATFDDRGNDPRLSCRLFGDLTSAIRLTGKKAGQRVNTVNFLTFMQGLGAGVFVTINKLDGRGAKAENVIGVRAFIADADDAAQLSGLHQFTARTGLPPTLMAESGGLAIGPDGAIVPKLQAYWFVEGCPLDQFTPAQELLNSRTGCDPSIKDLARVLRLPGFFHQKRDPRMTRIVDVTGATYDFADFVQRARAAPAVAPVVVSQGRPRAGPPGAPVASPATRDRLRALVAEHEGRLRPAVAAFLAEANERRDNRAGNRYHTLLTVTGALVARGWSDMAIHAAVTVVADQRWGGPSRHKRVQSLIDHARSRQASRIPAGTGRNAVLARAFGGGRG
jgi:hypothetical protein